MYRVVNNNNVYVTVADDDIDSVIKAGEPLKREIVIAMGLTHKTEYLPYLYPLLNHDQFYMRSAAAQSIFLIDAQAGLNELKQRERQLGEDDFDCLPSEKAVLQAKIIRIELGTVGVSDYFFSDQGIEIVKCVLLHYYSSGYGYQEEDIELITTILTAFVDKKIPWIKRLPKDEYFEAIYFTVESIEYASAETDILSYISDELCVRLCSVFLKIADPKISSKADIIEMIVNVTFWLREKYAFTLLKGLKQKVRGDARKAYRKALKHWNLQEDSL